jgi:hypothetical protein
VSRGGVSRGGVSRGGVSRGAAAGAEAQSASAMLAPQPLSPWRRLTLARPGRFTIRYGGVEAPHCIMNRMSLRAWRIPAAVLATLSVVGAGGQVIQFESAGLRYQTLSKGGVTVMFAHLPVHLHDYQIIQAGISNGSPDKVTVGPKDFVFERADGTRLYATPAKVVVDDMLDRATRNDVIKLISTYENGLNGVAHFRSTNGFEARRQNYLAEIGSSKVKAAAAASAIALVETRLAAGESTDGAVFFASPSKALGPGRLLVHMAGHVFEFDFEAPASGKTLQERTPAGSGVSQP